MRQVSFRLRLFQSERERASSERILRVLLRALAAADVATILTPIKAATRQIVASSADSGAANSRVARAFAGSR